MLSVRRPGIGLARTGMLTGPAVRASSTAAGYSTAGDTFQQVTLL